MQEYDAIPEKGHGKRGKTEYVNEIAIACAGRKRWKIENEGFNVQKNLRYDLKHANSHDWNALKNHYLITQIADIFRQLYVYRELKKMGLKKTEKNLRCQNSSYVH